METELKNNSFFENILLFIGIDVHKLKWVVTVRTYDLKLKTFSMKPSAEELEKFLLRNYPGADYRPIILEDKIFFTRFAEEFIK